MRHGAASAVDTLGAEVTAKMKAITANDVLVIIVLLAKPKAVCTFDEGHGRKWLNRAILDTSHNSEVSAMPCADTKLAPAGLAALQRDGDGQLNIAQVI